MGNAGFEWAKDGLVASLPLSARHGLADLANTGSSPGSVVGGAASYDVVSFHGSEIRLPSGVYVSLGNRTDLRITGPVTFACFHTPIGTSQSAIWCYAGSGSAGAPFAVLWSFGGNSRYAFWNDNNVNGVESSTYSVGSRNFIVCRRMGQNSDFSECSIFVNGVRDGTGNPALDANWDIADLGYEQSINRFGAFDGYKGGGVIGNILLWNRALSDAEIAALSYDPYGLFREPSPKSFFSTTSTTINPGGHAPIAASGNVPALSTSAGGSTSATPVTGTASLGGFAPQINTARVLSPSSGVVSLLGKVPSARLAGISFVGIGAKAAGDHATALSVGMPEGVQSGDLIIVFGYLRNAGTLSISNGYTQHYLVDTTVNSSSFYLQVWYRISDGNDPAITITPSGGVTSPQSLTVAFAVAFRGIDTSSPFGTPGPDSFNTATSTIGPISPATPTVSSGAVLVFGARNATVATSGAVLSGDGLTWAEAQDNYTNTVNGLGTSTILDYAIWEGSAPTLTAKTFTMTGGAGGPGYGKMFLLNGAGTVGTEGQRAAVDWNWIASPVVGSATFTNVRSMSWVGDW